MTARPADCASSPHLACAAYVCRWQVCGAQKLPTWRHRLLNGGEEGPLQEYFEQAANGAYGDTPPLSWNSPRNSTLWASIAIEHLAWPRTMQVPRPLLAWSSRKRRPRSRRAKKEVGGWLGVLPHDGRWLHRMVARAATSVSSWALGAVGSACTITRMPGTHFSSDGSCGLFHPRRGPPPVEQGQSYATRTRVWQLPLPAPHTRSRFYRDEFAASSFEDRGWFAEAQARAAGTPPPSRAERLYCVQA